MTRSAPSSLRYDRPHFPLVTIPHLLYTQAAATHTPKYTSHCRDVSFAIGSGFTYSRTNVHIACRGGRALQQDSGPRLLCSISLYVPAYSPWPSPSQRLKFQTISQCLVPQMIFRRSSLYSHSVDRLLSDPLCSRRCLSVLWAIYVCLDLLVVTISCYTDSLPSRCIAIL